MIKSLEELYNIIKILRSENGCPWDKAQTMQSIDKLFLEECFELSDAIQDNNIPEIIEELGDVSFMLLLLSHIAQQDNICHMPDVYQKVKEKMISRHPHIFADTTVSSPEEIIANWELIKKKEKPTRTSVFDGVPRSLPEMMRFDKLIRKLLNNKQDILTYQDEDIHKKSLLKNMLLQYASEGHSLSSLVHEINSEIESEARQKGL